MIQKEAPQELINLIGEKVTIWKQGSFGFGSAQKAKLVDVYVSDYAQYREVTTLVFRPYRKQKNYVLRLLPNQQCAIWKGWIEIDDSMYSKSTTSNGVTTSKSKAMAFDDFWMKQALGSTEQKPVFVVN